MIKGGMISGRKAIAEDKSEIRSTKSEGNQKLENKKQTASGERIFFLHSFCNDVAFFLDIEFPSDFGFRASDFKAGFGSGFLLRAEIACCERVANFIR
jgi:hypothetical protein